LKIAQKFVDVLIQYIVNKTKKYFFEALLEIESIKKREFILFLNLK